MLSVESCYFFTIQPPPISTRTATRFPYSTLFRSAGATEEVAGHRLGGGDHDVVDVGAEHGVQHEALGDVAPRGGGGVRVDVEDRSEEHTSELQSIMRVSYAVFCLKKKRRTIVDHLITCNNRPISNIHIQQTI